MNNYVIYTDSACDLDAKMLLQRGIYCSALSFHFDGDGKVYFDNQMSTEEFYQRMKNGECAKTSAVNVESFISGFSKLLNQGYDILYLGFSSALSTTYNSARLAAEQLSDEYPERKIITVDTLAASAGIALLIDLVLEKKKSGASINEAKEYADSIKHKICQYFTVDDLEYLKRGGRINPSAAFFGNMLGIKPLLHVDNNGRLVNLAKIRGRKTSIIALSDKYGEMHDDTAPKEVYISHADCKDEAEWLKKHIEEKHNAKAKLITSVGSVIGAHSGPGTIALFFVGKER